MKKIIIFSLIFFSVFGATASVLAAERQLETDYPGVPGLSVIPTTVEKTDINFYIKYIFNFAIGIMGLIAFGVLLAGGIKYLTSTGNQATTKDARDRMKSAFLGMLILLFSYIILTTINPQLVRFSLSEPEMPTQETPVIIGNAPLNILERIERIVGAINSASQQIKNLGDELKQSLDSCACEQSESQCDCLYDCVAVRCYGDPCKSVRKQIEELQRQITEKKDEINYYRMLLKSEMEDLLPELQRIPGTVDGTVNSTPKRDLIMDKNGNGILKNICSLVKADDGSGIVEKAEEMVKLPNDCLQPTSCKATCMTDHCHVDCAFDSRLGDLEGCPPDKCIGNNPCLIPISRLNELLSEFNPLKDEINKYYQELKGLLKIELEI